VRLEARSRQPAKIWSSDSTLELSHFTVRRPFPLHFHLEAIVAVIVEGAEVIVVNGRREIAEVGTIVVLEPECAHWNEPIGTRGVRYRGFYISSDLLPGRDRDGALSKHIIRDRRLAADLTELHQSLERHPFSPASADARTVVLTAFGLAARASVARSLPAEMRQVARTLQDRCTERLAWLELAGAVGGSAAHLARRFTRHFGIPPHQFQIQHRIALAKRLIREHLSLAAVAFDCGLTDQSHLTNQFARYVGLSPGAFAHAQDSTRP